MNPRPRLIHLTTTDISLALLLGPQLRAFADAGYDVIGVSAPGPYLPELATLGIRHVPLPHATRSFSLTSDARAASGLRRLFQRLRPDIVHTHNPKPGVYGRLAARAAAVPAIVNTVHGLYATSVDSWTRRAAVYGLERLAASCSDAELVQNPEDLETLARLGVPRDRLHLLGNGIDLNRFRLGPAASKARHRLRAEWQVGADDVVIGSVGRLVWEKGYGELFAAARQVRRQLPHARFVVAGPSDPGKADAVPAAALRAAEREGCLLLGHRPDVEDVYAALDVYALASYREGFPRSAMEAAAMGLPIVATDIRGCRQVVDDGVTGLLVPVRQVDPLAAAIVRFGSDPELRESMGRAAVTKAQRQFDQRAVINLTLEVYARLLDRRRHR